MMWILAAAALPASAGAAAYGRAMLRGRRYSAASGAQPVDPRQALPALVAVVTFVVLGGLARTGDGSSLLVPVVLAGGTIAHILLIRAALVDWLARVIDAFTAATAAGATVYQLFVLMFGARALDGWGLVDLGAWSIVAAQTILITNVLGQGRTPRGGLAITLWAYSLLRVGGWIALGLGGLIPGHRAAPWTPYLFAAAYAFLGAGLALAADSSSRSVRWHREQMIVWPVLFNGLAAAVITFSAVHDPSSVRAESIVLLTLGVATLMVRQFMALSGIRRITEHAEQQRQYFESLLTDSTDVVMIAQRDGVLSYVSPAAQRILGDDAVRPGHEVWTLLNLPERAFADVLHRLDAGSATEMLEGRRSRKVLEAAFSLRGFEVLLSVRDVTERDRLRQRLHYLAYHDTLTGLPNRSRVLSRISAMLSRTELVAVLFVDLDRFKQVNDSSGHAVGDQVLQEVARRLAELVRDSDLIGRLGGDEFVAVLSAGEEEAKHVAARIHEQMLVPFEVGGRQFQLGVSIGIGCGIAGLTAEDVLRRADLAMYSAKQRRGSWVVYESSLGRAALAQANLDVSVSRALREKDMDIYLQPLVELSSGRVCTTEVLLRWRDEQGNWCTPAELLDFARRSGRMSEVTSWVLQRSIEEMARTSPSVAFAVNVPQGALLSPVVPRHMMALLTQYGVPPTRLELEVTEDQLMEEVDTTVQVIHSLRGHGMQILIDDFGTGYSSLGYLVDLPIDGLKIDRRFTEALPHSKSARSIVAGLVSVAKRLDLRVVAEGIENEEQHIWARDLGVHYGQGYWYARPESAGSLRDISDLSSWATSEAAARLPELAAASPVE